MSEEPWRRGIVRGGEEDDDEEEEEGEFGKLARRGDALEVIFACKEMQLGSKKRHHCLQV